ncbi:MAG: hypothetical protein CO029_00355 [Candidatus Magasanikbacteria bacterium CG_4_9_14_0_2_um_filter_41_10]|nr:MAG: hypothetical protein CO029_00355 [Candidatus Magasanikbacteria bacterium CG_4_9_14_0_2_um_filter_41_10]
MAKNHNYYVYSMMSISGVLYIGVTNDLERRVIEHKKGRAEGFTKKYNCKKLVYFEQYDNIDEAIHREKQLKNWHREWKLDLIKKTNPNFDDVSFQKESSGIQILNQVQDDNSKALYIGRFQPFHLGHVYALGQIVEPEITIGIGSSQYSRTDNNPYTYEERKRMLESIPFEKKMEILPIPDIHDEEQWVEHVIRITGPVGIVYTGNAWVKELFEKNGYNVKDIMIKNPYSGTTIRQHIKEQSDEWKSMVPTEVLPIVKELVHLL